VKDRKVARSDPHPTTAGALTRLAYARGESAGLKLDPILKKAHLTPVQIEDVGARLAVRDRITFLNIVAGGLPDDFLGFHLALRSDLRELGWLYYVAASSDNLGEALRRAARYSRLCNEGISLRYAANSNVVLTVHYVGVSRHLDRHQIEYTMTVLVRLCRQLTGLGLLPSRVQFIHRRESADPEFAGLFGSQLEFGAQLDAATFAPEVRDLPTKSADPYLHRLLIAYCEEALARRARSSSAFRASVENAITPLLPHGNARAAEIARRLGTSQRTFARRLAAEGLTFSSVLENLRSDLAERYLADKHLSISEIAWLLGYREVSAFTHAFKRWTGGSPREARARLGSAFLRSASTPSRRGSSPGA